MITHSPKVENYPGYSLISGLELADKLVSQAMDLKVNFEFDCINEINKNENDFVLKGNYNNYLAHSIIIATGSKHKTLNLENEDNLIGKGISYCAVCDGPFYTNKDVIIVGGGNSAMQEALLLASYCKSVTIIQNLNDFTGEMALKTQIENTNNIKVLFNKLVIGINGINHLESIIIQDTFTNKIETITTDGMFIAIGIQANNKPFENICNLNKQGFFISTDCNTNQEGIYAAGDCIDKKVRQIVTATSDGAIAALNAIKYLDKNSKKTAL